MSRFINVVSLTGWVALMLLALGCKDDGSSSQSTTVDAGGTATDTNVQTQMPSGTDTAIQSTDTTESDVGEPSDTGALSSCAGVKCNTPPANACNGAVSLAVYNRVGWCSNGECQYAYLDDPCESGSCANGVCVAVPCQGVTCDTPPAAECVDANTLKVYNSNGYCRVNADAPECAYAARSVACPGGCQDDKCMDDPCAQVTCGDAPARYCDGNELVTWNTVPRCEAGACIYEEIRTVCGPEGCVDGRCAADDPCANVTCDIPPAAHCKDAATLRTFKPGGTCQQGACLFSYEEIPCANGCAEGQCTGEPCAGVSCSLGVVNRCQDNTILLSWNGEAGECLEGVCAYGVTGTACQAGCDNARCTEDPCAGVICDRPPANYCFDESTLLAFADPGACQAGACTYLLEQKTCETGCNEGDCEVSQVAATDMDAGNNTDTDTDSDTDADTAVDTDTADNPDTGSDSEAVECNLENAADVCGVNPCVDGYCCNLPCGGLCEACDIEGSRGICIPIPSGEDPDEECETEAVNTCGQNGFCDGDKGCERYGIETACNDYDICSEADHCDGMGKCVGGTSLPDFTPCDVVTDPDRDYDICVRGTCVSPGCGDPSCNVPGPHFPLADTNQRLCYGNSSVISCPDEGEAFYGQDAQYGWDIEHAETARYTKTEPVAEEAIVEDNVTGLVWQGCVAGLSRISCTVGSAQRLTWSEALAYCDDLDWGGLDDWRLPDDYEIQSIVYHDRFDPAIDTAVFPETPSFGSDYPFWSSSFYAGDTDGIFMMRSWEGLFSFSSSSASTYVRCVRGVPETRPSARFVRDVNASNEPVTEDIVTNLMWQGCAAGLTGTFCEAGESESYTWQTGLAYCQELTWAGHDDWRLPNVVELRTIVDTRMMTPSIDTLLFPATPWAHFWTATTYLGTSGWGVYVRFDQGRSDAQPKSNDFNVRCVRNIE